MGLKSAVSCSLHLSDRGLRLGRVLTSCHLSTVALLFWPSNNKQAEVVCPAYSVFPTTFPWAQTLRRCSRFQNLRRVCVMDSLLFLASSTFIWGSGTDPRVWFFLNINMICILHNEYKPRWRMLDSWFIQNNYQQVNNRLIRTEQERRYTESLFACLSSTLQANKQTKFYFSLILNIQMNKSELTFCSLLKKFWSLFNG